MKSIITLLLITGCLTTQAQKKQFVADCPDLKQKLQLIKQSFSDLGKFKKGEPDEYKKCASTLSLCGAEGVLRLSEDKTVLSFIYSVDDFSLPGDEEKLIEAFVTNFRNTVKAVFGDRYEETSETREDSYWGKSQVYTFAPYMSAYPCIDIEFPYVDDLMKITFQYKK